MCKDPRPDLCEALKRHFPEPSYRQWQTQPARRAVWLAWAGLAEVPPHLRDTIAAGGISAPAPEKQFLGDHIHNALSLVKITPERVTAWLGAPCGCKERQQKLNDIDRWAREAAGKGVEAARGWLSRMIGG